MNTLRNRPSENHLRTRFSHLCLISQVTCGHELGSSLSPFYWPFFICEGAMTFMSPVAMVTLSASWYRLLFLTHQHKRILLKHCFKYISQEPNLPFCALSDHITMALMKTVQFSYGLHFTVREYISSTSEITPLFIIQLKSPQIKEKRHKR